MVGRLFSSKNKDHQKRNLIVFITAKTLSPEGATYKDVFPHFGFTVENVVSKVKGVLAK